MINVAVLGFVEPAIVLSTEERREVSDLVHEFAMRLERERKPRARNRAPRFRAIASALRSGEAE